MVTGFSDGVDVRDSSTIQEIKRISVEHGKVQLVVTYLYQLKDIKYVEVNGEKRVFLRFANAYSANVVHVFPFLHRRHPRDSQESSSEDVISPLASTTPNNTR